MEGSNRRLFGRMPGGEPVEELALQDGAYVCKLITYGGAVRALYVPDAAGRPVDVALGFDTLADYRTQDKYIGALVGRCANRIGGSRFSLGGREYRLSANEGENHLHGGRKGFNQKLWRVKALHDRSAVLSLRSEDGEEGYPGALEVQVTYTLAGGALSIEYEAQSDQDTLCSLTNHTYFNLSGHGSGPVNGQMIQLFAGRYTPTGPGSIPTGELAPVDGTPMDLRTLQPIGGQIDAPFPQLIQAGGYDHNWAVDGWDGSLRQAARAWSPETGILLELETTMPGVQFYTGNFLAGCPAGKGGAEYGNRGGFCLETQFFPDAPNHAGFPAGWLAAGERYHSRSIYRFGIAEQ